MAINPMRKILEHLQRSAFPSDGAGLSDGQLLERYLRHREDAAFAALVRRHGPMVLSVCRRVLGNHHDAEDAFQASFLVLVRKASAIVPRERVANFLYGVAHTTALRARGLIAKRRMREKQVMQLPEPAAQSQEVWDDLRPLLDRELSRLPEKYRVPIVLCDLEDRPIKEAARQLGWPQGTLAGRLARARVMLAKRLARHGLTLSGGALALLLSQQARSALLPSRLIGGTMEAARLFAAGQAASGLVTAPVVALTEGVLKSMFLTKLKIVTAVVVVAAAALSTAGGFYQAVAGDTPRAETRPAEQPPPPRQPVAAKTDVRPAQTDLDRLQGIWSVVSIEQDGKPETLEEAVFMVDGKRACLQTRDSEIQGGLYLNPSRAPKTYDLAMSTKTIEGIYSLDGDTLRLCYGFKEEGKRPTRFATKKGDQQVLVVLKRKHGREAFPFRRADGTRAFPTLIEKENIPAQPPPRLAPQPSQAATAGSPANNPQSSSAGTEAEPREASVKFWRKHEDYNVIFDHALEVVSEFAEVAYANRYEGRIETANRLGKPAASSPLRRRACVQIVAEDDGGFRIHVQVRKEAKVSKARFDNKLSRPIMEEPDWKFIGRDRKPEQVMLRRLVELDQKEKSKGSHTPKGEERAKREDAGESQNEMWLRNIHLDAVNPDRTISIVTLSKQATSIMGLPIAQDANIKVKGGTTLAALKIGMRLNLRLSVVDDRFVVTEIRQERGPGK